MDPLKVKESQLLQSERLPAEAVQRFVAAFRSRDDWGLFRINPYRFARQEGFDDDLALDLFIHAARHGLVDFSYDMICPRCGGVAHSHHELDEVEAQEFYCSLCTASSPADLDDQVEVTFSVNSAVRKLALNPLENIEAYSRYHFSENYVISPQLQALRKKLMRHLLVLQPGQNRRVRLQQGRFTTFQFVSMDTNTSTLVHLNRPGGNFDSAAVLAFSNEGFRHKELQSTKTDCEITVQNETRRPAGFLLTTPDLDAIMEVVRQHPTKIQRFLTAR